VIAAGDPAANRPAMRSSPAAPGAPAG